MTTTDQDMDEEPAVGTRPASRHEVGSVSGVVGAAGGLGGFVPPLVWGALYGELSSYALRLAVVAAGAAVFTAITVGHAIHSMGEEARSV